MMVFNDGVDILPAIVHFQPHRRSALREYYKLENVAATAGILRRYIRRTSFAPDLK